MGLSRGHLVHSVFCIRGEIDLRERSGRRRAPPENRRELYTQTGFRRYGKSDLSAIPARENADLVSAFLRRRPALQKSAAGSGSKTKPRFCLAAMNDSMNGIIQSAPSCLAGPAGRNSGADGRLTERLGKAAPPVRMSGSAEPLPEEPARRRPGRDDGTQMREPRIPQPRNSPASGGGSAFRGDADAAPGGAALRSGRCAPCAQGQRGHFNFGLTDTDFVSTRQERWGSLRSCSTCRKTEFREAEDE